METFRKIIRNLNQRLTRYLYVEGDTTQIIIHKKIWWLLCVVVLLLLFVMIPVIGDMEFLPSINILNLIFYGSAVVLLIVFHFYRKGIFNYILLTQLLVVLIHALKVYLEGGIMHGLAPIFVGLMCVAWAIILPDKRRANLVFVTYLFSVTAAALGNYDPATFVTEKYHLIVFVISVIQIYAILYYYIVQYEKLKQQEQDRLKEMDAFKTKFYTNITHEFRTPLTIIMGLSEQLTTDFVYSKNYGKLSADQTNGNGIDLKEGLEMISRNGSRLLTLTNQMLDLSKVDEGAMQVHMVNTNFSMYMKYVVESFHSYAQTKNITISFSSEPADLYMDFDPDKIQDVIFNLVSNALKFTQKGGKIDLNIQQKSPKQVEISITDNGPGIPKEILPKIFDRYFQVEEQRQQVIEGSGLGLSLTRELVKLMGGEISVHSTPGIYTTFTISLPITNDAPVSEEQIEAYFDDNLSRGLYTDEPFVISDPLPEDEKMVVLVVEDNEDVIYYIQSLLSQRYRVITALNGLEGFDKAVEKIPDLIISDIMMPVMDGFTLCKKLKTDTRTSHIPVVMLTALADTDSKIKGLQAGADAYLPKPFNRRELFVRIQKLIEIRQALQDRFKKASASGGFGVTLPARDKDREDAFLTRIIAMLENHMEDEEFTIDTLCKQLAMSRSQLYRKFNAVTDTTLHQFILNYRLTKARELLGNTDLNVTQVALATGFKNLSHFSSSYSGKFGINPSEVRMLSGEGLE
jgi:signal transduction histidine kinase/CheY-like chemotaxis protein/AraC-like DNA-binding protein